MVPLRLTSDNEVVLPAAETERSSAAKDDESLMMVLDMPDSSVLGQSF